MSSFDITSVSEERRTPLDYKTLIDAQAKASDRHRGVPQARLAFENANRPALEAIAKLEKDPARQVQPGAAETQGGMGQVAADALAMQKAAAAAKAALSNAIGPAEASLAQPGQPAFVADKFKGELVSKDVTLNAEVARAIGDDARRRLW